MATSRGWNALVSGGTGATGKYVVAEVLRSEKFANVTVIGRREISFPPEVQPSDAQLSKLKYQKLSDLSEMDSWEPSDLSPSEYDVAFCCLGTTRADAGSAAAFRKIDYDGVVSFGRLAQRAQVKHMQLVTSQGASKNSFFLYPRTKGEAEEFMRSLSFEQLTIFRPPLLDRGHEARTGEKIAKFVLPCAKVHDVAKAMVRQAEIVMEGDSKGEQVCQTKEIRNLFEQR